MTVLLAEAVTLGPEKMVTSTVAVLLQPELDPVTVYVVEMVGLTTTEVPVNDPGIHV